MVNFLQRRDEIDLLLFIYSESSLLFFYFSKILLIFLTLQKLYIYEDPLSSYLYLKTTFCE